MVGKRIDENDRLSKQSRLREKELVHESNAMPSTRDSIASH
jgi:hypothetical protein